jgi:hypothetical protein
MNMQFPGIKHALIFIKTNKLTKINLIYLQIKKNLFPRSRTHSHSSGGDKDESANVGSPHRVASSLKVILGLLR